MRSFLLSISVLTVAVSLQAAPSVTPTSEPAKTAPAVQVAEKASENFPLTLRGFFGKGDKTEISVQDKPSGKSVWLKPGSSHSGWKLESADAATGRAVLSQGERRVSVLQAGETHGVHAQKLKSMADSVVMQKFIAIMEDSACAEVWSTANKEACATLRASHPEFFDKEGHIDYQKPGAVFAESAEIKRRLLAANTPAGESVKAVMVPMLDATIMVYPAGSTGDTVKPKSDEELRGIASRVYELADELYYQRTGGK
jgi:hypothetical protein